MVVILLSCMSFNVSTSQTITIKNNTRIDYNDKVIELKFKEIKNHFSWLSEGNFKIINKNTKKELPYQLEYKGIKRPINVLIQLTLKQKEKLELTLLEENPSDFKVKTFARFVPERADDFAWENDKIAFRTYGKALELTPKQNAYGIDVWVKRTDKMIINERYKRGKYHEDHGDGLDYYHVGYTLGAGNCAPFLNDSIWYSKNYTKYEVLDNGPLRTTFKLYFDEWDVAKYKVRATKTITLDAGSQCNKIEVHYYSSSKGRIPIAVGIIKREEEGHVLFDKQKGVLGYWEPTYEKYGTTGVGVVIPLKMDEMKARKDQYLAVFKVPLNKVFTYYSGAAWDRAGEFTSNTQWFNYLKDFRSMSEIKSLEVTYSNNIKTLKNN
ncbi:DUF4861 family protein [Mariniflexile sp. HNIBRBA6329]|uniref:DUF4861 family protein n=1 Tax=Mariniflexile sp. HNIBRBA6329 TaxID=3373088 RepID=UPI0037458FFA